MIHEFTLNDKHGNPQEYTMRQHPTPQGLKVVDSLISAGLGGIVEMFFNAVSLPADFDSLDEEQKAKVMGDISAKMDRKLLVGQFLDGLKRAGGLASLAPALLAYTHRNGRPLNESVNFDSAYQGNYAELMSAAQKSVEHNAFFELFSTLFA